MTASIVSQVAPKTAGIYTITCMANGRVYVGSARDVRGRWRTHRGYLKRNAHTNAHMQNAWNKYGENLFEFSCVETVNNPEELIEREQFWIDKLKSVQNGFNLRKHARSNLGIKYSEESKQRISDAHRGVPLDEERRKRMLGKPVSKETRLKISEAQRGRPRAPHSEETKRKLSEANRGKTLSAEHRQKLSDAHRGISKGPHTEETRRKMSEAQRGKSKPPISDEHRRKLSESGRKAWENRRAAKKESANNDD